MPGINRLQWPLCYMREKGSTPGGSRTPIILSSKLSTMSLRRRAHEGGDPRTTRTSDTLFRKQVLFPLSYEVIG